jgi:transposase-like protein
MSGVARCPYCKATDERIYERGRGAGFVRYRCKDCLGEFDVDTDRSLQDIANEIRAEWGLPPLDPPNPITGFQRR